MLSLYRTDVVGAESAPNSVEPAANVVITPNVSGQSHDAMLYVADGTSIVVTLWYYDTVAARWIALNSPLTVSADVPAYIAVPPGVRLWAQLGTNTGSVTKFGLGFTESAAIGAGSQAQSVTISGGATSAKQDTGNTSLANLDTKQPALGTAAMVASSPVTIATNDTLMAAIKADVDKIPSKGSAIMTGAAPVTLATDDTLALAMKNALVPAALSWPAQVTTSGVATQFASAAAVKGIWVQADYSNTTIARVCDSNASTARGKQLAAGDEVFLECTNANAFYHIAESGTPKLNYRIE